MNLDQRCDRVADDSIGVLMGLLAARDELGDDCVTEFLDNTVEEGAALWEAFRAAQKTSGSLEYDFVSFVKEFASN